MLGHIGARGTAYWNVRLLDRLFDFDEIRVHSRRPESRDAFAARLSRDLGKPVHATDDWQSCVDGADIVVEASRLAEPAPMLKTEWIKPGALVVPYGTMSAVELSLTDIMAKIVVDDWGQCKAGQFGALRAHVEQGKLSEATLHAEMGEIVAGLQARPRARRRDHPVLASRLVALRHRARQRHAGEGGAARHRPAPALRVNGIRRQRADVFGHAGGERGVAELFAWVARDVRRSARISRSCGAGAARDLWARDDLGAAFMCGFPFASAARKPAMLAAPVPSPPRYGGRPRYCTDFVVRADSASRSLRHVRRPHRLDRRAFAIGLQRGAASSAGAARRQPLYRRWVGPLVTPRRVIERCSQTRSMSARSIPTCTICSSATSRRRRARLRVVEFDRHDADPAAGRLARRRRRCRGAAARRSPLLS